MHCVARTVSCCGLGTFWKVQSASLLLDRTVSDFAVGDNLLGLIVAAMSVVSSGMQQIFCRSMQQKHKLSSHELLSNTAPAQVHACQPRGRCRFVRRTRCPVPAAGRPPWVAGTWQQLPACWHLPGASLLHALMLSAAGPQQRLTAAAQRCRAGRRCPSA